jgi:hypothetical protein
MVHLESHVATKTFLQVNRTVKTLVVPGISFGGTVGGAGFGGSTIHLGDTGSSTTPSPESFGEAYMTINDLIFWNPSGDGRANLSQIRTNGTRKDVPIDSGAGWWNFSAGPVDAPYVSKDNIHSPIHDPDVRALYPVSPCRTTDAKLCVDVNMGGGSATIRAVPFTKDMCKLSPKQLREHILADRHVVQVIDIGGDGKRDKRLCFPKWVQSRKAVGEFTNAKLIYPALTAPPNSVQSDLAYNTPPVDIDGDGLVSDTSTSFPQTIYSDEFCYGGWVFMFENIAPATYGSLPFIRMASVVNIQVQLSLADNHLRELGPAKDFARFIHDHQQSTKPGKVGTKNVQGSPVEDAMGSLQTKALANKSKPSAPPRKGGVKNLRGSHTPANQAKMSKAAARNRQETLEKSKKALEMVHDIKQRFDALAGRRRGKNGPRGIQNTPFSNASLERPFGRSRRGKFRVADGREL